VGKAEAGVERKADEAVVGGCAVGEAKKEGCFCAVLVLNPPKPLLAAGKAD